MTTDVATGLSRSRPAPYRQHLDRDHGGEPARTDGPDGPCQHPGRSGVPARHRRPAARDRHPAQRSCPAWAGAAVRAIGRGPGNATGTWGARPPHKWSWSGCFPRWS